MREEDEQEKEAEERIKKIKTFQDQSRDVLLLLLLLPLLPHEIQRPDKKTVFSYSFSPFYVNKIIIIAMKKIKQKK